ncbi:MAG: hypothetical protein HY820_30425 [Acidobacteria bacterium]|nr:hypothetical protein [Acidobacteriota bacterium]
MNTFWGRREFLLALAAGSLTAAPKTKEVKHCGIGWEVIRNGRSRRRYLHIHGDETTAREVLRGHMLKYRGIAYLVKNDERTIPAGDGRLDPNRMLSRGGAERNLRLLNKSWTEAEVERELARLDRERVPLLKALTPPKRGLLFAVHNNARGYSVQAELDASNDTALNDASNPHEFFLATDPEDFRILRASPFNAVLQNEAKGPDDGSMSRLMASRGVRYLNLEVAIGKTDRQREMMEWAERRLR